MPRTQAVKKQQVHDPKLDRGMTKSRAADAFSP